MKTYAVKIRGISDFMYGRHVEKKESHETYEQHAERVWKQQVHHQDGKCFIQPFAFKNALESAARWLSLGIPGEGKKTFTKRFASGIIITDRVMLVNAGGKPITIDDIKLMNLFVPSDGKRGSGKRVWRFFPTIYEWCGTITVHVLDDKIDLKVLEAHCDAAGKFIGMGAMRVENGGINGRFDVVDLQLVSE